MAIGKIHSFDRSGLTLIELLVIIVAIALFISALLPTLAKSSRNAGTLQDMAQMKEIHATFLKWSNDNKDILPTPGMISRLPPKGSDR